MSVQLCKITSLLVQPFFKEKLVQIIRQAHRIGYRKVFLVPIYGFKNWKSSLLTLHPTRPEDWQLEKKVLRKLQVTQVSFCIVHSNTNKHL